MNNHPLEQEEKSSRIIYSRLIIFIIGSVFVLGIFTSFAYFTLFHDNSKNTKVDLTSGTLGLTFSDRDNSINKEISLGETITKKFTVENTGTLTGLISFEMTNMVNTYSYKSLTYDLEYCKENCDSKDTTYTKIIESTNMPVSKNPKNFKLANEISVPAGSTYYYNLNITYNNTDFNQETEKDSIFTTNFQIGDASKYRYYSLFINPNGGSWNNNTETQEYKLLTDETKNIDNPTKKGYTFAGWEIEGSASTINNNIFTMGVEDTTLKANWTLNKHIIKVNINGEEKTFELGIGETLELEVPVIDGKRFTGWDVTGGTIEENTFTLTEDKDITITAKLEDDKYNYIVNHYKMNTDGTSYTLDSVDSEDILIGTEVTPATNSYKGFKSPEVQTITISNNQEENVVNYYYSRNQYTLTIDPAGGIYNDSSDVTTRKLYYDETIDLKVASKTGYTFSRWKKTEENDAILNENSLTMKDSDLTVRAVFTAKDFTITFNANGGVLDTESKIVTYDSTYGELPTPTYDGYEFLGWFTERDAGEEVTLSSSVTITEDQTLYAHWKYATYTVTFDANGGSVDITSKEVSYNQPYGELPTATKDGFNFDGWYTEIENGVKVEEDTLVTIKNNHTLYAQFTIAPGVNGTLNIIGKTPKDDEPTFANTATTDETADGLYSMEDDYGTSYYYRGAVTDNYVKFAGLYWRIIRVNGDGSLRIIYDGNQGYANGVSNTDRLVSTNTKWNMGYSNDNKYVGYMYGGINGVASTSKEEAQTNETSSNIKEELETWYKDNIYGLNLDNYINDNIFCNDRSTAPTAKSWWTSDTTLGYGTNKTAYGPFNKFVLSSGSWNTTNPQPSFKCTQKNDAFTKSDTEKGNGKLSQKVGLINSSEIVTAGSGISRSNSSYYLYKGTQYYSISPHSYSTASYVEMVNSSGYLTNATVITSAGLVPVINLSPEFVVTLKGTGTIDNPFTRSTTEIKVTLDVNGGDEIEVKGFMAEPGSNYTSLPEPKRNGYLFDGWFTEDGNKVTESSTISSTNNHSLIAHWVPYNNPKATDIVNKLGIEVNEGLPNFASTATTDEGVFSLPDEYGSSYFYRGAVEDNYVYFADYYWRIIRVNGDGSLRIIYDGTDKHASGEASTDRLVSTSIAYSTSPSDNKSLGYMYSPSGTTASTSKEQAQTNENDSNIKMELDKWYQANITEKGLDEYIGDETFCNDRSTPGKTWASDTGLGYSNTITGYGMMKRLLKTSSGWVQRADAIPQFACSNKNDSFTKNDTKYGNGSLTNKIGLITIDEVIAAGGKYHNSGTAINNKNYYLYKGTTYWTMTPNYFSTYKASSTSPTYYYGYGIATTSNGGLTSYTISTKYGLVPVINLSYDYASTFTGTGSSTDPYRPRKEGEVIVTLDAGDIEINPDSIITETGNTYGVLPTPTKTGYTFGGWFTEQNGNGTKVESDTIITVSTNHTLYASMIPNNYTVTLNGNGITSEPASITVVYNSTYGELPELEREGYTFNGWYTATSGGTKIEEDTTVTITANQTLYARWTANKYTIYYDANTGTCSTTSKTVTFGSTYSTLATPTKTGYNFSGWFTESSGGTKITSSTKVTTASDHTLYAQWTLKNFTVTFNANGGTNRGSTSTTVYWGEKYNYLPYAEREGYQFDGWWTSSSGGTQVTNDTTVNLTGNQTLYAHWIGNNYTVYFDANHGSVSPASATVTMGATYGTLPTPTYSRGTFLGWYTAKTGGTKVTNTTKVSVGSNHTLYAHWQIASGIDVTLSVLNINANSGTPNFGSIATTNEGVYTMEDDYGTSYYYRGAVTNNYVKFAGFYWRIIRVNGNGSIRMIYDGTYAHDNTDESDDRVIKGRTPFNDATDGYHDAKHVGYMYAPSGTTASTSKTQAQTNTVSSTIKTRLEDWYNELIVKNGYDSYVADTLFCNDRSIHTGTGYGNTKTLYGPHGRLAANNSLAPLDNPTPQLKCPNKADAFTKTDTTKGNGKLSQKIGLITIDEVNMAGGNMGYDVGANRNYYLHKGYDYPTMSPAHMSIDSITKAAIFIVSSAGFYWSANVNGGYYYAPVINLTPVYVAELTGNGTKSNPYFLE